MITSIKYEKVFTLFISNVLSKISEVINTPFVRNDTTFLHERVYSDGKFIGFQRAYIERDKNSDIAKQLLNYSFFESDDTNYNYGISQLKKLHPEPFTKYNFGDSSTHWIPIKSYKGIYYLYEMCAYYPCYFTDSLYVRVWQDGPSPYIIISFDKKGARHYQAQIIDNYSNGNIQEKMLDFYLIDVRNGITVVAEKDIATRITTYQLMVTREKAAKLDIIAWISNELPDDITLHFDEIDYEHLILQSKIE